jgi:hypothetical protein
VSNRDRLKLTPDLTTRWATGNDNFVYSSQWDFKSSFTCRKILRHGTFPLYFPSERKVCCGFLSSLKIHRLDRVLNLQPLGPMTSTINTTPPRRPFYSAAQNTGCVSCAQATTILKFLNQWSSNPWGPQIVTKEPK